LKAQETPEAKKVLLAVPLSRVVEAHWQSDAQFEVPYAPSEGGIGTALLGNFQVCKKPYKCEFLQGLIWIRISWGFRLEDPDSMRSATDCEFGDGSF